MATIALEERSVSIILANQSDSGAYLASPNFQVYRYSWLRDGAYIAYAMDRYGASDSAERFHQWAAEVVLRREAVIEAALSNLDNLIPGGAEDVANEKALKGLLHARYKADGSFGTEEWANFQPDGYGTWLWAVGEHKRLGGNLSDKMRSAVLLTRRYLQAVWRLPSYDLWEESPGKRHTYSLASIYAGLKACEGLGMEGGKETCEAIRRILEKEHLHDGYFVKWPGSREVDASLMALSVPYSFLDLEDPRCKRTLNEIEDRLTRGVGVHRYETDTYYGGGVWVLLTAWLAWVKVRIGDLVGAERLLSWVEAQADSDGSLPEQVAVELNDRGTYSLWIQTWGEIAKPLLWSHAMYLVASAELRSVVS